MEALGQIRLPDLGNFTDHENRGALLARLETTVDVGRGPKPGWLHESCLPDVYYYYYYYYWYYHVLFGLEAFGEAN